MSTVDDSVRRRFERVWIDLTPAQIAVGLLLLTLAGFVALFAQDPLVHDSLHNFRHVAGVTCH